MVKFLTRDEAFRMEISQKCHSLTRDVACLVPVYIPAPAFYFSFHLMAIVCVMVNLLLN